MFDKNAVNKDAHSLMMVNQEQIYHPSQSRFRWIVLLISAWSIFGFYYCFDNPTALATQIQNEYNLSNTKYNLLYSVYSFPNMLLPVFGGALVDRIGANTSLLIFLCLITLGQALFTLAAYIRSYSLMLVSRIVYGLGGESLLITEMTLLILYFKGETVALALGLSLSLGRSGSALNDFTTLKIYKINNSIPQALGTGFLLLCSCLIATAVMIIIDKCITNQKKKLGYLVHDTRNRDAVKLSDIKSFSALYWLLVVSCVVVYGCVLPWNNIGSAFMQNAYHITAKEGNNYLMIPYLIVGICAPLFGYICDKIGKRGQFIIISIIALTTAHCIFVWFNSMNVILPLCLIGISFSLYTSAALPAIGLIVKESQLATAIGFISAVGNGGLALISIAVGSLTLDHNHNGQNKYYYVEVFFFSFACFGVMIAIILWYLDNSRNAELAKPSIQKTHQSKHKIKLNEKDMSLINDNDSFNDTNRITI